jgi:hypothetical protein
VTSSLLNQLRRPERREQRLTLAGDLFDLSLKKISISANPLAIQRPHPNE